MLTLIVWIHNLVYRVVFGLIRFTVSLVWRWTLVVVALLGEEVRRYIGLTLSGIIIVLFGKATLNYAPESVRRPLVVFSLVVLMIWALALRRAFRYTRHNNLQRMRNKKAVRDLHENVKDIRGRVSEGLAQRTQGTPMGGAFRSNREASAKAEAAAHRAAEQAERDRVAQEHNDRERDRLADLEPSPFT